MGLENPLQNIKGLAGAYGFIEILPQKNPVMISFAKEEESPCRINYYFTTGTVQVQFKNGRHPILERNVTLDQFEDILLKL